MFENASKDDIIVSYQKLLDCQVKINTISVDVKETLRLMFELLDSKGDCLNHWQGPAREAFNQKYKNALNALAVINGKQKKNSDVIGDIIELYKQNETDLVSNASILADFSDIFVD